MSPSRRGLAVGALVGLVVVFVGLPSVLAIDPQSYDPADCTDPQFVLWESSESPSDVNVSGAGADRYRNLTATERALVDRARESLGERVPVEWNPYATDRFLPQVIVHGDTVYRAGYRLEGCPVAAGVPPAFNPVVRPIFAISRIIRGPLAVGLLLATVFVGARWVNRKLQY